MTLIGASRGATAVLAGAARLTPPPTAVISISGRRYFAGESALDAASHLTMPVLYLAAKDDASAPVEAQALYDATPGPHRNLVVVPGGLHGLEFVVVAGEGAIGAIAAIEAFLLKHAPAVYDQP